MWRSIYSPACWVGTAMRLHSLLGQDGGGVIGPGKESGWGGTSTQQYNWNLCALLAQLILVHYLPMGQLDRDGGLGKALLECKSCLMLNAPQCWTVCTRHRHMLIKTLFSSPLLRYNSRETVATRSVLLSFILILVTCTLCCECGDGFFLFWIARGKRKDWFMCATDHLLCVPPSLGVLISDLPPLSIITPATLFGQMGLCWSLSRSLFQGCGQLLLGLRRCLPLVDSKEKKGDLNLQTTSIGGNFLVLWSGTVVGCSLSSTLYILFTELSFCIMDLLWHM